MKIKMTKGECYCGIQSFYDNISHRLGYDIDANIQYDCSRIEVSNNVFDEIYEYYRETDKIGMDQMGMIWCCFGPKCKDELGEYDVNILDGFIKEL